MIIESAVLKLLILRRLLGEAYEITLNLLSEVRISDILPRWCVGVFVRRLGTPIFYKGLYAETSADF